MKTKEKIIILGAGLAGLMAGYKLTEHGYQVNILDKENQLGGLARTIRYKDYLFDFSAHRFHTNNGEIMNIMQSLLGDKLKKQGKRSRIYMFGKYLKYPFEPLNLFKNMPISLALKGGMSYMFNKLFTSFNHHEVSSFKDWYIQSFGKVLYEIQCKPYASKLWHMDPSQLSSDWASQRVTGFDLSKVMKVLVSKAIHGNISKDTLDEEKKFPDLDPFYYPDYGFQMLADALAVKIIENGGIINTGARIQKIKMGPDVAVEFNINGEDRQVEGEKVISSIPLRNTVDYLDPEAPPEIKTLAYELKYLNIIFVYLIFNKEKISDDSWLYFPTEDIIFNRAVEFKNWSSHMCPKDTTALCFDITCREGDTLWKSSDAEIVSECVKGIVKAKIGSEHEIIDSYVYRVKYAYPIYELDYKEKLIRVVRYLERNNNFFALGRTGVFRYNNADNSLEMGLTLAKAIVEHNSQFSLLNFKINNPSK
jgi:protoporphyrinogen oxidase